MINCATTSDVDCRQVALSTWLTQIFQHELFAIIPITGDASFRRYFRIQLADRSYIAMDAPPEKEDCAPFITIATAFTGSSLRFPTIHTADMAQGFLLLSDFGDQQLLPLLNAQTVDDLYGLAIKTLQSMQKAATLKDLPHFDEALFWREFDIFSDWYVKKNLQQHLSTDEMQLLRAQYQLLIDTAYAQPQVFVHRDYHSRNLMLCEDGEIGILDFQDAVIGPVTYDLVSLLRDCYIAWPLEKIEQWAFSFYQAQNISVNFSEFLRWFDWMGLQRHLKCLGIFSRLYYRDQKNGYLKDIPRVLSYAITVCERYPELHFLKGLLKRQGSV